METDLQSRAVRVDGEILVLRCWACGTQHYIRLEQCTPRRLAFMVCSKSGCSTSLFLVNELAVDEQSAGLGHANERKSPFAALSRLWK